MSPQVIAAIIVADVSVPTLFGTLAAQYFSRLDTRKALEQQSRQLGRTFAEQRNRILNESFATAAAQLDSEASCD
jgi:hypothetical protein